MAIEHVRFQLRAGEKFNWSNISRRAGVGGNPNAGDPSRVRSGETVDAMRNVIAMRGKSLVDRIGLSFIEVAKQGTAFIYQGGNATVEVTFELSETVMTIRHATKLATTLDAEGRLNELTSIFTEKGYSFDEIITKSRARVASDVPQDQIDDCPLVYVSQIEAEALAKLLGVELPTEKQWERAASGTTGLKRPWDTSSAQSILTPEHAVYYQEGRANGTRPVKSKPAGKSPEGIFDLIGNVWEWTKEVILRGGSWSSYYEYCLQAGYRVDDYRPDFRYVYLGVRFSRTEKK
jgi:iron(II)-dependent oxidoreductase